MTTTSTNLGLTLFNSTTDATSQTFLQYRTAVAGTALTSNFNKIDSMFGVIKVNTTSGTIGIGITPALTTSLAITKIDTQTSGSWFGGNIGVYGNPSSASSTVYGGLQTTARTQAGNVQNFTGAFYGSISNVTHQGSGTLTTANGLQVYNSSIGGGTLTNSYAVHIINGGVTGVGSSITNQYGLYVDNYTSGSTLNYSIYTNTGLVRFGDKVTIGGTIPTYQLEVKTTSDTSIEISGATAKSRQLLFSTDNSLRWVVRVDGTAESGANAGSDFSVIAKDDAGGNIGTAFIITRSTLSFTFGGNVQLSSGNNISLIAGNITTDTTTGTKIGTATTQKLGFWNSTPIVKPSAFTQTYSTTAKTITQTTMTDPAAYVTGANGYSTTAMAQAIHAEVIALRANMIVTQNVLNAVIDDLQSMGLLA